MRCQARWLKWRTLVYKCVPFGQTSAFHVPAGSPSRGGDVAVYVFDISQPSSATPFHSVLVSVFVFMALWTVFQSIKSSDNSPLSHSVPPVLFWLAGPFNYVSLYESLLQF